MPASLKNYHLIRFIKSDGSYDLAEDILYVGRNRVPPGAFFYPAAKITYYCDDHADDEMIADAAGIPTCRACGRQPES